ncbi:hypothetical protein C8A00DRAFT_36994 [Chaetomidium leptoderma]|uniref:Uncharacterized protein n=1 Tax=Chaetomidium leptoderma TaxID=669021 RepID=A0AAN6ZU68_9PEZI|nr:hypothetical protein C8A00DRAFT_36994 [Chaetomidium leptoderma]
MDAASTTQTTTKTPSLHSRASSTTLVTKPEKAPESQEGSSEEPQRYVYGVRTAAPNPNAQLKPKSKLSKFMSKFESPAVRKTKAAHERQKLEEERTGIKIYTPMAAPGSTSQSFGAFL